MPTAPSSHRSIVPRLVGSSTPAISMKKAFRSYLPAVIICLALVGWLGFRLDLDQFLEALTSVSAWAVISTLAVVYLSLPIRAVQWQWLLGHTSAGEFWTALKAICVGHLGNFLLPARGGELVRAYHLAQLSNRAISRILPSVVLSRL